MIAATTTAPRTDRKSLAADTSGAILVMGLFMSVLLVGALYYIIGIGHAVVYRETIQDAADGAAYSAAIIHARGMNLIVMLNVLMATLLAVLVVLKLISSIAVAAIGICVALAFWTAGASMAPVPALNTARQGADSVYNTLKGPIFKVLAATQDMAHVLRRTTPIAAQIEVMDMSARVYSPTVRDGVMFPLLGKLPTEDGDFKELCAKAGGYAGTLVTKPLDFILQSKFLSGLASSGMSSLAGTFSSYFCGDGGVGVPSHKYKEKTDYPRPSTPEARACEAETAKPPEQQSQSVLENECQVAGDQIKQASESIDRTTGKCRQGHEQLCQTQKDAARSACAPGTANLKRWWWQQRSMEQRYRLIEEEGKPPRIEAMDPVAVSSRFVGGKNGSGTPPCTSPAFPPSAKWTDYNTNIAEPACTRGFSPPSAETMKLLGQQEVVDEYDEVTDLFACQSEVTKTIELDEKLEMDGSGKDKAPQRIMQCADLGESMFQVRVGVRANLSIARKYEPGVAIATWGKQVNSANSHFIASVGEFGQFAFAQAEYYYAGAGATSSASEYAQWKDEWMWNMAWRARLRRLQFGKDEEGCVGSTPNGSSIFQRAIDKLDGLLLH